jgi:FtsP/CotA-like multicopper oxidase with cupredoxin domain
MMPLLHRAAAPSALAAGLTLLTASCQGGAGTGAPPPLTRTYYVAAEEVTWDYAPSGRNLITDADWNDVQRPFVTAGDMHVGRLAKKAIYREYTDSTFTARKPRPPEWEHLGIQGPLLRAVVGDTIRVVFLNRASFPASMHPHGVFYLKDSEGAPYEDGTEAAARRDDAVPPGSAYTYIWPVPERAGPSEGEGSTAFWMYHSHTTEVGDVNAGLIGPMIITARARAQADATPDDVDRELVVGFLEFDETNSTLWQDNLRTYGKPPAVIKADLVFGERTVGPESQYAFKETMNGFLYGNTPGLSMHEGERVRWYLMASTNFEMHAPHWHGNTVRAAHMTTDVTSLLPMGMLVADMVPDNPGVWLFHCHVAPHLLMGMEATYEVLPKL